MICSPPPVSVSEFAAYEREHQNRTTFVVAPTMQNFKQIRAGLNPKGLGQRISSCVSKYLGR
jgi:hypothetical protein